MSKQLVLFFTDESDDWDAAGRNFSSKDPYEIPEERPTDSDRVLLVFDDSPNGGYDSVKPFLEKADVGWADEVYVALHDYEQDERIEHGKLVSKEYHHELSDRTYKAFRDVVESDAGSKTTSDETRRALQGLVASFNMDWLLETKLEMLHRCLTEEGAKTLLPKNKGVKVDESEKFPGAYSTEKKSLMDDHLDGSPLGDEADWDVEDVVCALANEPLEGRELPEDKRQKALAMMRDALLKDE